MTLSSLTIASIFALLLTGPGDSTTPGDRPQPPVVVIPGSPGAPAIPRDEDPADPADPGDPTGGTPGAPAN